MATPGYVAPAPTLPPLVGAPPYPGVPVLDQGAAILCLIVNFFLPGIGTIIAGAIGGAPLVGRGIAQLLLAILIVGWIWGLVTGFQLLSNSGWARRNGVRA